MALFTELDIYADALELAVVCNKHIGTMDRNYRGTLGADMRQDCRKIIQQIQIANSRMGQERVENIEKLRWTIGQVETAIRICTDHRLRLISHGQQAELIQLTQKIGKKATGWKQRTEHALANPGAKVAGSKRN